MLSLASVELSQGCGDVPVSQNGRGMLLEHSEVPRAEGAVGVGRVEQRRRAFDAGRNLLLIAGRPGLVDPVMSVDSFRNQLKRRSFAAACNVSAAVMRPLNRSASLR